MALIRTRLPVHILREGKRYIAYTPALDLSTSGTTFEQAKQRFVEATELFFEELGRMGTLHETLTNLGWQRVEHRWAPPIVVSSEQSEVMVPA